MSTLTPALRRLIADAEQAGYTTEDSHSQFFTLKGKDGRRDYSVFLNAKDGFDHALLYRGDDCLGSMSTLGRVRLDIEHENYRTPLRVAR